MIKIASFVIKRFSFFFFCPKFLFSRYFTALQCLQLQRCRLHPNANIACAVTLFTWNLIIICFRPDNDFPNSSAIFYSPWCVCLGSRNYSFYVWSRTHRTTTMASRLLTINAPFKALALKSGITQVRQPNVYVFS